MNREVEKHQPLSENEIRNKVLEEVAQTMESVEDWDWHLKDWVKLVRGMKT